MTWAGQARGRLEWRQTATILAMLANVNRDAKRSTVFSPDDFDPYVGREQTPTKAPIEALKVFLQQPQQR